MSEQFNPTAELIKANHAIAHMQGEREQLQAVLAVREKALEQIAKYPKTRD